MTDSTTRALRCAPLWQIAGLLFILTASMGMGQCGENPAITPGTAGGGIPSSNADLSNLTLSAGTLTPAFAANTTSYSALLVGATSMTVTPTVADSGATVTVNGTPVTSGNPSGAIILTAGGQTTVTIVLTAADTTAKTYTVTVTTLNQQAYTKASNTGASDQFGLSIALDSNTLVVGAKYEDSNATGVDGNQGDNSVSNSGAVYVFTRSGGVWSQQAYVKASNSAAGDNFGSSVAIYGDTLVVGAPGEDSNATGVDGNQNDNSASSSGAVYVFTRTGGVWSQQAYIKASNTGSGDNFGWSLALSGDTLAVGAYGEDSAATGIGGNQADDSVSNSGAVYVFTRSGGVWSQQAYVKASNPEASDDFGASLALSGDTLAVGADLEDSEATGIGGNQADNSAAGSGAVYIFTRSGGVWSQQAYIKASNTGSGDNFGWSLALSGDTLAVGAYGEDSAATGIGGNQADDSVSDSGAVYVFTRSGGVWSQQAYVKASTAEVFDNFGWSLALSGDTLAVGAYGEDSAATGIGGNQADNSAAGSGAAYVFTRGGATWTQQAYVKASTAGANDGFGWSLALSGDTLALGANAEDSNATGVGGTEADNSASNSGAVFVFQ